MKKEVYIGIITLIVGLIVGFYFGRQQITGKTEYVKVYPIKGFSEIPITFLETIPNIPKLLYYTDSSGNVKVDSAAIARDWITERQYYLTLFDSPEIGKLTIYPTVQYNQLQPVRYEYLPIQKVTYRMPVWQPYIGAGYNSFNQVSVSVGTFYHKIGLEILYIRDLRTNQNGIGGGVKVKF